MTIAVSLAKDNPWNMENLSQNGLPFLEGQKAYQKNLTERICIEIKNLTFLVPFDGSKLKQQIKVLKNQVSECYLAADHYKKCKIGVPEEYSKFDKVAIQAFKQMDLLDSLDETVTFMERKNIFVLGSVGFGILSIGSKAVQLLCGPLLSGKTLSLLTNMTFSLVLIGGCSLMVSFMHHQGSLQPNYYIRFTSIREQYLKL